jgi:hypothetical protein
MRKDVTIEERTRAIQRGVREALREHALLGHSISVWEDGKVVWLTPAEVLKRLDESKDATPSAQEQIKHD